MSIAYERTPGILRLEYPLLRNLKDGSVLVRVPAGEFEMGDGNDSDCPKHRVHLSAYCIGVYCVTNAQYLRFVEETGHRVPDRADYGSPVWSGRSFPQDKADHPVVCVSWDDAMAYAAWAGCALPTEAQWEKATRGPKGLVYPWGDEWDPGRCQHAVGRSAMGTCRVYDHPEGMSGYGMFNQAGNVLEWCRDWYQSGYYGRIPRADPMGPYTGSRRVDRGGSWRDGGASLFRGAYRDRGDPADRYVVRGFRLARAVP